MKKHAALTLAMAMASTATAMEPLIIENQYRNPFDFTPPNPPRMREFYPGMPLTNKQRKARAATKRQRKARQRQAKQR